MRKFATFFGPPGICIFWSYKYKIYSRAAAAAAKYNVIPRFCLRSGQQDDVISIAKVRDHSPSNL